MGTLYHGLFSDEGKAFYHPCIYKKMMTSHRQVQYLLHIWNDSTDRKGKNLSKVFFFLVKNTAESLR
jgi:beta-1,3-N-acetylglucosaminyltransferase 5